MNDSPDDSSTIDDFLSKAVAVVAVDVVVAVVVDVVAVDVDVDVGLSSTFSGN